MRFSKKYLWWFPEMGAPPHHPILMEYSLINHPAIGGTPMVMETTVQGDLVPVFPHRDPQAKPSGEDGILQPPGGPARVNI